MQAMVRTGEQVNGSCRSSPTEGAVSCCGHCPTLQRRPLLPAVQLPAWLSGQGGQATGCTLSLSRYMGRYRASHSSSLSVLRWQFLGSVPGGLTSPSLPVWGNPEGLKFQDTDKSVGQALPVPPAPGSLWLMPPPPASCSLSVTKLKV